MGRSIFFILLILSINIYAQSDLIKIADSFVNNNIKSVHALGTIVGVIHKDEIIYSKGIGQKELGSSSSIDRETLFRIGSML
ncbi:MAG: beta-lactamase family protein [Bacteriovoracaceae bacterium]|jgi:CubicO group peptidase (beta-lactamase class C family)|nr:beta-lactamase family protein [Bacteriovoracaceae bacterium]